jgi:hypothetical protein
VGQAALVGGLVTGVLSALPILSAGNICCCLWIVTGGLVAAYVLQQEQSASITPADGMLVGLLAGLIGAVIQVALSIPINLIVGPMELAIVQRAMDMAGSMPPEVREAFDRFGRDGGANGAIFFIAGRMVALAVSLFLGAVFSTLGGLIGAAIFKKPAAPGTFDVAPPTA